MIQTSGDILNIVLAVCISLFTFFVLLLLYYVIRLVKKADDALTVAKEKFEELHSAITAKLGLVSMVGKGMEMVIGFLEDRKKQKKSGSSRKKGKK